MNIRVHRQKTTAHTHPEHVDNCQERRSLTVDDQNEVASHVHIYTATLTRLYQRSTVIHLHNVSLSHIYTATLATLNQWARSSFAKTLV